MLGYFAFLHPPENGSSWGVTFPDLAGCVSAGDSLEDAVVQAREALSGHLAAMRADGDSIPRPRSWVEIEPEIKANPDPMFMDGVRVHYIMPRQISGERVRVNITIDKALLRTADEAADARGLTRSGLIEAALLQVTG